MKLKFILVLIQTLFVAIGSTAQIFDADTFRLDYQSRNFTLDHWFLYKNRGTKTIYSLLKGEEHRFLYSRPDTIMHFDFVVIDSNHAALIKSGKLSLIKINQFYENIKNKALINPESEEYKFQSRINDFGLTMTKSQSILEGLNNRYIYESFYLPQIDNNLFVLGKKIREDIVWNPYFVKSPVSKTNPIHASAKWELDNDALDYNPLYYSGSYNDSWGYSFSSEILVNAAVGVPINYLQTDSSRLVLMPTRISVDDYIQCQFILIRTISDKETDKAAESKFRHYESIIKKDPRRFEFYLDSTDFWGGKHLRDTFRSFVKPLVSGFREKVLSLKSGEIGFTDKTEYGYYIIKLTSPVVKKDDEIWCWPLIYRRSK